METNLQLEKEPVSGTWHMHAYTADDVVRDNLLLLFVVVCVDNSCVGDKMYLYGGIEEDGAKTCAEGLYLLTPGQSKLL